MIVALVLWVMVLSFVAFILNPRKVKNPHFHPLQVQVGIHQEHNLGSTIVTVLDCHTDPRLVTALPEFSTEDSLRLRAWGVKA
jgi:hypothetical protein